jgi:sporulation protein YlmC with PRC-barrel domain
LSGSFDLGLALLDRQLLDSEGRRCGKVDDVALEGGPGDPLEIAAILSGPPVLRRRAPIAGRLATLFGGDGRVRVPWAEVVEVGAHVKLRKPASEYGLGRGDDRLKTFIEKIPGKDR